MMSWRTGEVPVSYRVTRARILFMHLSELD